MIIMRKVLDMFFLLVWAAVAVACSDTLPDDTTSPGGQDDGQGNGTVDQIASERPGPDFRSEFQKHIALWEFTGAWCANCPGGYTNMNFVLSTDPAFTDYVHPMAFHSNTSGTDDLALAETDRIMTDMNLVSLGFPSYIADMLYGGSLVEGVGLTQHLYDTFEDNPCFCGVAVSSDVNGDQADVTVKLIPELNSSWRVAVFVVEDKVKYYQLDGMKEHDRYTHRHVVRRIVSTSYKGDRIGSQANPAGTELTADYDVVLDAEWNLENTYVYILALDGQGVVNNMNVCHIDGGNADYSRI